MPRKALLAVGALLGGADAYALTSGGVPRAAVVQRMGAATMMADRKSPDSTDWSNVNPEDIVQLQPSWNDPREGEPFGKGDRDPKTGYRKAGGVRVGEEAYQPRGISDATVIKPMYIETDDEPWHSTCRPTNLLTKGELLDGMNKGLPFVQPELDLEAALRAAKGKDEVEAALSKFVAAGARPGSPATKSAEKMIKAYEKDDEKGAEKAKPKKPAAPKAQGTGWDVIERKVGKTHDNSVS